MTRASAAIVLGLVSGMMVQAGAAQTPLTVTVRGRVLSADTGDPIRNARVGIGGGLDAPAALTDAEGRFALDGVPRDQSELVAAKTGYANIAVAVPAASEIRLVRGGVITGRVLDDAGAPLALINVVAQRVVRARGGVTFERFAGVETDDLGDYRLFGLPAGEFVVAAAPGRVGMATTTVAIPIDKLVFHNFYPHAATAEEAQPIAVQAGEEKAGIDFTISLPPMGPMLLTPGGAVPQAPPPARRTGGTGVIRGRVADPDGLPIRRARVQIMSVDRLFSPYANPTDDEGRYEFPGLRAGSYLIIAGTLGGRAEPYTAPGGASPAPIKVADGAVLEHVDITLSRPGVISGRIVDEYGDPMANANVHLYAVMFSRGRQRLVDPGGIASRLTNDLGRFRVFGLPPGRYLVAAAVGETLWGAPTAPWPGYARTYYPGTPMPADAQFMELGAGQQALTVDFPLVHGRIARVSGTAFTADGKPLQGDVSLNQSYRSGAIATPPVSVRTDEQGAFEFTRIPPGEYVLQAATRRATVSSEGEFASQFLAVNGVDVSGVAVHLSAGSTIEGRLTFDGGEPPEDPDFHLSPIPMDPDQISLIDNAPVRADIHDDWTFDMSGITGPRILALTQAPEGWMLKAVRVNGIEATDTPLMFGAPEQSLRDVEVVLTNRAAALRVTTEKIKDDATDFRVIAFAADRARRYNGSRFRALGVPARDGTVTMRGLPPGDYYVVALAKGVLDETTAHDDAEFLEALVAGATRVTLSEAQPAAVTVTLVAK